VAAAREPREQGDAHGHREASGGAARVRLRMATVPQRHKRTPLYDRHVAAGARLVPFAGWEMPVQYAGIREEHVAVRTRAGVFDVSHIGEGETTGPHGAAFLRAAPS